MIGVARDDATSPLLIDLVWTFMLVVRLNDDVHEIAEFEDVTSTALVAPTIIQICWPDRPDTHERRPTPYCPQRNACVSSLLEGAPGRALINLQGPDASHLIVSALPDERSASAHPRDGGTRRLLLRHGGHSAQGARCHYRFSNAPRQTASPLR